MKAIITVIGRDQVGIMYGVSGVLQRLGVNIEDVTQTIMQEYFTMIMLVDTAKCTVSFSELSDMLKKDGESCGLSIRIQREDIFNAMHRI